ncbi:hypothetical protein GF342_02470 [Candidatus Woesearchaeota archaeon]|nr:hypothetical protein [Candidatus Woesearchaeota archaeon]
MNELMNMNREELAEALLTLKVVADKGEAETIAADLLATEDDMIIEDFLSVVKQLRHDLLTDIAKHNKEKKHIAKLVNTLAHLKQHLDDTEYLLGQAKKYQ